MTCIDLDWLSDPPWSGISINALRKLVRLSGQTPTIIGNHVEAIFLFCINCGRVLDNRFDPSPFFRESGLCIHISSSEVQEHSRMFEISKKQQQKGEKPRSPLPFSYEDVKRELGNVQLLLLDLVWMWKTYDSRSFVSAALGTCSISCAICRVAPVRLTYNDQNENGEHHL